MWSGLLYKIGIVVDHYGSTKSWVKINSNGVVLMMVFIGQLFKYHAPINPPLDDFSNKV
jgi:hypothetical protein